MMCRGDCFISQQVFIFQVLSGFPGLCWSPTASPPGKIRDNNTRDPLGALISQGKHIRVLSFPREKSLWELLTSGQLQSIHFQPAPVVWIAGIIDLGDNSSWVPPSPRWLGAVLGVPGDPWHRESSTSTEPRGSGGT